MPNFLFYFFARHVLVYYRQSNKITTKRTITRRPQHQKTAHRKEAFKLGLKRNNPKPGPGRKRHKALKRASNAIVIS